MKLSTILFTILLFVSILVIIPPTHAESYYARIYVSPDHGHKGLDVYVDGINFSAYSKVYIYFDNKLMGIAQTNWYGYFDTNVEIPVDAKPGTHVIKAVDQQGVQALTTFTVTTPTLYLNTTAAEPYSVIRVTGSGYAASQYYLVAFDGLVVDSFVMAKDNETIDATVVVPPLPNGEHHVAIVYISSITSSHIVVASKTIIIKNGYVDNQSFTQAINKVWERINSLNNTITTLRTTLEEKPWINYTDAQLEKAVEALAVLKTRLNNIAGRLNSLDNTTATQITTLKNRIDRLENTIAAVNKTVKAQQESLKTLSDRLRLYSSLYAALIAAIAIAAAVLAIIVKKKQH